MTEDLFTKLHKLQSENAELGEKLSFLKIVHGQVRSFPSSIPIPQQTNQKAEIEKSISIEMQAIRELKKELIGIEHEKIQIQKFIDEKNIELKKNLEQEEKEVEQTTEYYAKILEKCSNLNYDTQLLKQQMDQCTNQRQKTFEMKEELLKLTRLITFQRTQQDNISPLVPQTYTETGRRLSYAPFEMSNHPPSPSLSIHKKSTNAGPHQRRRFSTFAKNVPLFDLGIE